MKYSANRFLLLRLVLQLSHDDTSDDDAGDDEAGDDDTSDDATTTATNKKKKVSPIEPVVVRRYFVGFAKKIEIQR